MRKEEDAGGLGEKEEAGTGSEVKMEEVEEEVEEEEEVVQIER